jgi:5-methylcytosine-specific restriction enzyme subunit McrC
MEINILFLYASDLARFQGHFQSEIDESPDLPTLIARLLCFAIEKRCRRNLSRGYKQEAAVLTRVRGRIDVLTTISHDLLRRGAVACRYENHTVDTVRNRLVRAALSAVAPLVSDPALAHHCRMLANSLRQQGVSGIKPSRGELSADQIGRHDAEDRLMVSLAHLVFDLGLPTEGKRPPGAILAARGACLVMVGHG